MRHVVRVLSAVLLTCLSALRTLVSAPVRRGGKFVAAVVSGALIVVLATQSAEGAITAFAETPAHPVLPQQRGGSAAGLSHRTGSAVQAGRGTAAKKSAAALPEGAPNRPGKPRKSFTGPVAALPAQGVTPPASVRSARLQSAPMAPDSSGTAEQGDPELPGPPATGVEITSDRTSDTSVFANSDGTLTARVYSRPVHYRTASGDWADIDTTLTANADGRWAEGADSPSASFAATGNDPSLVTYGPGAGEQVAYGLQGASAVQGQPSGNAITYQGIAPSSDLTYEAIASGVKETLTLHSASAPTTWVFPLHLTGLTASLTADGSITFTDGSGDVVETIPHGFMEDSALGSVSHEGAVSTGVTYSLTTADDGSPALRVSLDTAWLKSPDRVYPVTVDPTNLNATSSTYVETPYDINFSTADTLKVGSYDGGTHKANSYLLFGSLGTTFKNDYIEKASLYLDNVWSGGCSSQAVVAHAITSSWSVGSIAAYPGLSYGSAIGSASFDAGASCGGSSWHGIDIGDNPSAAGVKLLEGWAHGGANHGLALTADLSKVAAWKQFASVNSSYPPYLSITYSSYGADYVIPKQTYTEPTATTAGSMKVTLTNRGTASWSTTGTKLSADIYSTSWTKLSASAQTAVPTALAPNASVTMTGTIPALAPGQYYVCWDMHNGSTSFYTTYGVPEVCAKINSADTPPQVDSTSPPSNAVVGSVTPQLFAGGHDPDAYPGGDLTYDFQVYSNPDSGSPSLVADSGWVPKGQWSVPVGKLGWNRSYYWVVADSDGAAASDWSDPSMFSTTVPEPLITSHLGAGAGNASGRSFDPQVGDYTTSATDAGVPVVGPALDVSRTYNSLDPRTGLLFGAGWSSRYDMTVQPDNDSSGGVVVTGADGRQERFGRNSFELNQIASAGDQTGDQVDDALAVDQTTGTLWLYPGPDFSALSRLQVGSGGWNGMAWLTGGDVNSDGVGDLDAVRVSDGTLWMYPGVAGGGYGTRVQIGSGGWNGMAILALTPHLGSDGKKDLVAAQTSDGTLWAYPVNSDGSLSSRVQIGSGGWNGMAELMGGDFNGDGHGDVAAVEVATGKMYLYPGTGSNTLSSRVEIGVGWNSMSDLASVTGISGDGTVDILATQKSSGIRYLYHSGPTFSASSYIDHPRTATGMAVYTPAAGEFETLGPVAGTGGGWALQDKSGTTYTFGQSAGAAWKLTKITDRHHNTQTLSYNPDGTLAAATSGTGGRSLHFTWSGGHVSRVATDPATQSGSPETWTYAYDGDDLDRVCPPASDTACTAYSYTSGASSGSHFRSAVLDANPSSYWRLADSSGTAAASEVAVNEGNDRGAYASTGVTLGSAGPLPGSPTTAAAFDGAHGYVSLPNGLLTSASYVSIGLWFKSTATTAGVLFSYQKDDLSKTSTPGNYTPALYVGTSGKLYGQLVDDQASSPIASTASVADGQWHYVVLTGAGDSESLYLDGSLVGTKTGEISTGGQLVDAIGDGFIGGSWPDEPHASTTAITGYPAYFHGQIAEVAFYTHALGAPAVSQQFAAGSDAAHELTGVTLPSGKTGMTTSYDAARDRAGQVTDRNGGTWGLGVPSTSGSSEYYHAAVLSSLPYNYWRFADSSGSQGANDGPNGNSVISDADGPATYHNVTLGAAGPFAGSPQTAASFDGSSSYASIPNDFFLGGPDYDQFSIELWFKTTTSGETLFSYQSGPIGTALAGEYTPALYIGGDGHLYGELWDHHTSPMESPATVDDGKWHQVVLAAHGGDQVLSLDGKQADTRAGDDLDFTGQYYASLGAGYLSGNWPSLPAANPQGYFKGSMAEVALFRTTLDADTIADQYAAWGSATGATPVTTATVTDPGNHPITYRYDPGHGNRLVSATDALGSTTSYGYDRNGFLATTTDPDTVRVTLTHNARGDVLSRTTDNNYVGGGTSYYVYPADGTYPVTDPRSDEPTAFDDARSTGPDDTTYRTTYAYSPTGDLLSTTDADGNVESTTYTTGSEAAVGGGTEPPGLVATAKDANGNVTAYGYDSAGDLAKATAPSDLTTSYTYDSLGRRLTATQVSDTYPSGVTTAYAYNDDNRLVAQTGPATTDAVAGTTHSPQAAYSYDDDGNTLTEVVSDTTGGDSARTTTWAYNDHGQLESATDPVGNETTYAYDPYGNTSERTDADGSDYAFTYSPTGELLTTTLTNYTGDPVAPTSPAPLVVDSRAYDPAGLLSTRTDSMGRTHLYYYDDDHHLTADWLTNFHEADGSISAYWKEVDQHEYDYAGHLTGKWETDLDTFTRYTVDPAGRTTQATYDPGGMNIVTSTSYDPAGHVTSQSVTDGVTTDQTDRTYDALGDVTSTIAHNGTSTLATTHTYDQRGVLTSTTDPRGNLSGATAADFTTTYATDQAGQLTQTTAPVVSAESNGALAQQVHPIILFGYDTFGDMTSVDDADGNLTTYTYDADGEQTAVSGPAYTAPGSGTAITADTTATYTASGELATSTDGLGGTTHYTYDQLGDLARVQEPAVDGSSPTAHATYDTDGEVLQVTEPTGAVSAATYDDLGRQVTVSEVVRQPSPAAYTTKIGYDGAGNPTEVTQPGGEKSTVTYDVAGHALTATDPLGNTTKYTYDLDGSPTLITLPDGTAQRRTYDPLGRETERAALDATGAVVSSSSATYDAVGNMTAVTDANHSTTTYTWDALDNLVRQTEPVTSTSTITTTFGHDAASNTTRYTDGNGNSTTTTYNTLGLPESTVEPATSGFPDTADRTSTIGYDADGQAVSVMRPGGVTLTNTYDAEGRLTGQSGTGAEAATTDRSFGYDADGRLVSASAPGGTNHYTYDDRGDITSASGPSGTASYTYNADDLLSSRTDKTGTATYVYDADGRLATATDPLTGSAMEYTYNAVNQVTDISYGTGAAGRSLSYDDQHRLTGDSLTAPGGSTEASATYGYDPDGRLTSQTTTGTAGAGAQTFGYDQAGRLTSAENGSATTSYGYDDAGNRTSVSGPAGATAATYNARDQLTGTTAGSTSTAYTYSARGTLTSVGAENLTYDAFDQLTTDGGTSYSHDAFGRLAAAGGSTFTYDGTGSSIVSDGTEDYGRGPGGALLSVSGTTGAALAYNNRHGDLAATFTATGIALAGSTAYDAFGQTTATAGTQHDLGYQDGWTDPASRRIATDSRWYDPAIGGFTSHDASSQAAVPSTGANPYAYGDDDPTDNSDPAGTSACSPNINVAPPPLSGGNGGGKTHASGNTGPTSGYNNLIKRAEKEIKEGIKDILLGLLILAVIVSIILAAADSASKSGGGKKKGGGSHWGWVGKGLSIAGTLGVDVGAFTAANPEVVFVLAAGHHSCNTDTAAPQPPPPSAQIGVQQDPGPKPKGQADPAESPRQNGTKNPDTGPGDAAPSNPTGALPVTVADPGTHHPGTNGTSPAADNPSDGLGNTSPSDIGGQTCSGGLAGFQCLDNGNLLDPATGTQYCGPGGGTLGNICVPLPVGGPAPASGGGCSFSPDTPVLMADGATKPIGEIKPGDKVESADPASGKHAGPRTVTATWVNHDSDLVDVTLRGSDGKPSTLHTTANHPFWDDTSHAWVPAGGLKPGHALNTDGNHHGTVLSVHSTRGEANRDNLTVAELHTYYVVAGDTPILVHNTCGDPVVGSGNAYSVAYETKIPSDLYPGRSRGAHFQAANRDLVAALDSDADFAKAMDDLIPGIRNTLVGPRGGISRLSPSPLWTWHHAAPDGLMQLVPRIQHEAPGNLQNLFHPGGVGGFSIWG